MKAVSNLRSRIRTNMDSTAGDEPAQARRRARTSGSDAFAFLSPPLTDTGQQRAWAVEPRKLRGLHPAPLIIYVRESPNVLALVMDRLYGTLLSEYGVDSRDMRVSDVPTAYDLPGAVRRMGMGKQLVVVVGLLARDKPWFDESQVGRVREFMLAWSQQNAVPLVDGILIGDTPTELQRRVTLPSWTIKAPDWRDGFEQTPPVSENDDAGYTYGHYLAHRAVEMFYFEHRGW
ncbi:hypothetical protein IWW36_001632 [Coemansia brasiliensis]|uniref:6,7-dimethyl-8-ribityllumazine synthase n=1 Tax=Coemansia brasiliensis TaxID=2650707 RepID=A0A9W8IB99_9FUNG|nr:hypothetical protein IWW36_001632 [Coemansia brasiliensis]